MAGGAHLGFALSVIAATLSVSLLSSCSGCGDVDLQGSAVCGNGVREGGEECDSEAEPCNEQHCGGGVRACTPQCTWGECIEDHFGIITGPVKISGDVEAMHMSNILLWNDGYYSSLFMGMTGPFNPGQEDLYYAKVGLDGGVASAPAMILPPSLVDEHIDEVYAAGPAGDYPVAFLVAQESWSHATLNYLDSAGSPVMDPGNPISLWECNCVSRNVFALRGEFFGLIFGDGHYVSVAVIDRDGRTVNLTELETSGCEHAHSAGIITNDNGYAAFFFCSLDWVEQIFDIRMQHIDVSGFPVGEAIAAMAGRKTSIAPFGASWTGSQYGILFLDYIENSSNSGLLFTIIDETGVITVEPFQIGKIRENDNLGAIAWSGSEFAVAFSEDLFEQYPEDPSDYSTTVKIVRLSPGGDLIGEPVEVFQGLSDFQADRIVWTGSRYGVSWLEPYPRDSLSEIGTYFAQIGCMPQD